MDCLKNTLENNCCVPVIEEGHITLCNPLEGCVAGCCTPFFACLSKLVETVANACKFQAIDLPEDRSSTDSITYTVSENYEKKVVIKVGDSDEE